MDNDCSRGCEEALSFQLRMIELVFNIKWDDLNYTFFIIKLSLKTVSPHIIISELRNKMSFLWLKKNHPTYTASFLGIKNVWTLASDYKSFCYITNNTRQVTKYSDILWIIKI